MKTRGRAIQAFHWLKNFLCSLPRCPKGHYRPFSVPNEGQFRISMISNCWYNIDNDPLLYRTEFYLPPAIDTIITTSIFTIYWVKEQE